MTHGPEVGSPKNPDFFSAYHPPPMGRRARRALAQAISECNPV